MTPLTVSEARAILIADEVLRGLTARPTFEGDELTAWTKLVESANDRIKTWGRGPSRMKRDLDAPTEGRLP